jgi:hypothetical protein
LLSDPSRDDAKGRITMPARRQKRGKTARAGKVGADPKAARKVGGKGDFGVPEGGSRADRQYVSEETKANDPGGRPPHSYDMAGEPDDGERVTGVGGSASGVGSSSGGDVDTDLIGVAGAPVSQAGPDDRKSGPDMVEGDRNPSDTFASRAPAKRGTAARGKPAGKPAEAPKARRRGTSIDRSGGDVSTTGSGGGAGAVTNPNPDDDDSFAGEVSLDEASGADNSRADNA